MLLTVFFAGLSQSSAVRARFVALTSFGICLSAAVGAQSLTPPKQGAELLKTDIMGIFAHPDDETGIAATLASYALGRTSIVANVYCTRGEGGGNMVGTQSGAALGALREAELRDCLSTLGVRYCYFLDQLDWAYTESLAATLDKWGKEQTLAKLVRLVRALRPEIIVTMNPAPSPGQHGHHQAAAVLATEAFTAAADPGRFPLQLTKEGLSTWQPRRLFYGGGSGDSVVTITVTNSLPNGGTPAETAARALANHRSQAFGNFSNAAWLQRPQKFTVVKSLVPLAAEHNDLLQGLPATTISDSALTPGTNQTAEAIELEFVPRPAFANYRKWVKEQGIEHVAVQFEADLPLVAGEANLIRIRIANNQGSGFEGDLGLSISDSWRLEPGQQHIKLDARSVAEIELQIFPPVEARSDAEIRARLVNSGTHYEAKAKLHPLPHSRITRLSGTPSLDGTDHGWEGVPALTILPTDLVQGTVKDEADSSATFRIAHDDSTLFLDVKVKDDVVVSNIAPNDIKGHWRSDSVEICLDPKGGAEHTMDCYKLGIFPFDTTGVVRGERDADANQGPIEETAPRTRISSRRTSDGYRIQAAIPFEEAGLAPGQKRIGFDLIIYDGDKRDAALGENINKSRIAWAPRSGVQGRPEDWGRLDLE
jgi:LmbE family N-acetylglucosaminyl deacetylase